MAQNLYTYSQLDAMTDEGLFVALRKIVRQDGWGKSTYACLKQMKGAEKIFFIVDRYDVLQKAGGLCRYFTDPSRRTAPYLSGALAVIGADHYQNIFDTFVATCHIDLNDLSSFMVTRTNTYEKQQQRYPFAVYDDMFTKLNEMQPLREILVDFSRRHVNDFLK